MTKNKKWDELEDVLSAQDLADFFKISRRRVYELFDLNPSMGGIPNYPVGGSRRADKEDVKKWKDGLKAKKQEEFLIAGGRK